MPPGIAGYKQARKKQMLSVQVGAPIAFFAIGFQAAVVQETFASACRFTNGTQDVWKTTAPVSGLAL